MKRCFLNERLKNIFLKNRDMRFIKMTGGLGNQMSVSYTHLRAHETGRNLVCRLLLEKKKKKRK